MAQEKNQFTLLGSFTIQPQGARVDEKQLGTLLDEASKQAVRAAKQDKKRISVTYELTGGFGGLGEIGVALHLALPYLKEIGKELADGTLVAAGEYFFNHYLAPQLIGLNLLPSKFQAGVKSEVSTKRASKGRKSKGEPRGKARKSSTAKKRRKG